MLFGVGGAGRLLDETRWTQPALFVLQVGLATLWRSWGVVPDVVLGHSVGEFAAAWCAGVLDLEDALDLIVARGALMQELPRCGAMAAVFLDAAAVADAMAQDGACTLAIAAVNAPEATVVSGEREAMGALLLRFSAQGVRCQGIDRLPRVPLGADGACDDGAAGCGPGRDGPRARCRSSSPPSPAMCCAKRRTPIIGWSMHLDPSASSRERALSSRQG